MNSMAIAIQSGASSTLVAMDIDAALAEDRVVNRMNKVGNISDATSKVLKKQLELYQIPSADELSNGIVIDANLQLAEQTSLISKHIESIHQSSE